MLSKNANGATLMKQEDVIKGVLTGLGIIGIAGIAYYLFTSTAKAVSDLSGKLVMRFHNGVRGTFRVVMTRKPYRAQCAITTYYQYARSYYIVLKRGEEKTMIVDILKHAKQKLFAKSLDDIDVAICISGRTVRPKRVNDHLEADIYL